MEKYALMTYPMSHKCNIGDYIQSLAAEQFLPHTDMYLSRENLNDYCGEKINLIMNGWFMHSPQNWPPSVKINPLFISFHMNALALKNMIEPSGIDYFKRLNHPIGCRDYNTMNELQKNGIDAYFSGCLTTTLGRTYKNEGNENGEILFVDALFKNNHFGKLIYTKRNFVNGILKGDVFKLNERKKIFSSIFSTSLLNKAKFITHIFPQSKYSELERFEMARNLLQRYAKAKLVVTSRIHCALPCLALGTPVIFLNSGLDNIESACRFEGIIELFNTVNVTKTFEISSNFNYTSQKIGVDTRIVNPTLYKGIAEKLEKRVVEFIERLEN